MVKTVTACNWVVSRVTEEDLEEYVQTGFLAKKEAIHWRVPGNETHPEPKDGEVVVLWIIWTGVLVLPAQDSSVMCCIFSSSIHKIADQIPFQTSAISKCSTRCTFNRSPP